MFNSYASGGRANASANNYLNINAVCGTLVKNHPKSIFVIARSDSTIFDPTNPRCLFPKAEAYTAQHRYPDGYVSHSTEYRDIEVPCVVLQAMIIGDGLFSCEIVKTEDFIQDLGDNNVDE